MLKRYLNISGYFFIGNMSDLAVMQILDADDIGCVVRFQEIRF